jgi:hypothetical protein
MEDLLPRFSVENSDLADGDEPRKSYNRERLKSDGKGGLAVPRESSNVCVIGAV